MPELQFECRDCGFSTKKYNLWRKHLLEETHQIHGRERSKKWGTKDMKKSLVVFGLFSVKKSEVLKHFGDLALVTDYVFWKERPDFCILQFLTTKFRENIISSKLTIHGLKLFLRPREEISEEEWFSICPFLSMKVKTEVNLGESSSTDQFSDSSDEENAGTFDDEGHFPSKFTVSNGENNDHSTSQSPSESYEEINRHNLDLQRNRGISRPCLSEDSPIPNIDTSVGYDLFENRMPTICTENGMDIENEERNDIERYWNEQLEDLYNQNLMDPVDWELRKRAKLHVEELLKSAYPNCVLIPCGLGSSPIASVEESWRMFLDIDGLTNKTNYEGVLEVNISRKEAWKQKASVLLELTKGNKIHKMCTNICMEKQESTSKGKSSTEIKFEFLEIKCKIGLNSFIAAQCFRILKFLCTVDHRVRPLMTLVHHWAVQHSFVKSNCPTVREQGEYFHPTVLQWLVIFYLIHRNILPSIMLLQNRSSVSIIYNGVPIGFSDDLNSIKWGGKKDYEIDPDPVTGNPVAKCIITLAQEMFKFLGDIELERYVISPNLGALIPINVFRNSPNGNDKEKILNFSKDSHVFVQHPLKLSLNMTFKVIKPVAIKFTTACRRTSERLDLLLNERRGNAVDELNSDLPETLSEAPTNTGRHENLHQINVTPDVPVPIATEVLNEKKIKSFVVMLYMNKGFVAKAVKVKKFPEITKAIRNKLFRVWLKGLYEFNSLVWPICFGIQIVPLLDFECDSNTKFTGKLIKPKRFHWACKEKNTSKMLKKISKMLKYARTASVPDLQDNQVGPTKESFTFVCKIHVKPVNECEDQVRAAITFSEVRGTVFTNPGAKTNWIHAYASLWKSYSCRRLLTGKLD